MKKSKQIQNLTQTALLAALICVCAWISVPVLDIAFTMQTFAVFLTLELLGGKRGTLTILLYLIMGAAGLPVFTGFRGGLSAILGATGGYLAGFLVIGLVYWAMTQVFGAKPVIRLAALVLGLLACYGFGSLWFFIVYLNGGNGISLGAVIAKCVLPYLLPDAAKLAMAWSLSGKLRRFL